MRRKNMDYCECDRCGNKEILAIDSPTQAYWHDCQRITGDGKVQTFLLDQKCFDKHKDRMLTEDKEFNVWMGGE